MKNLPVSKVASSDVKFYSLKSGDIGKWWILFFDNMGAGIIWWNIHYLSSTNELND